MLTDRFGLCPSGYLGMRVFEEPPPPPKIQLSEHVDVSEEFRQDMNAWLLYMFGRRAPLLRPGECLYSAEFGAVVVGPGVATILSNSCA